MQEKIDYLVATWLMLKFAWNGLVATFAVILTYLGLEEKEFLPITLLVMIDMVVGPINAKTMGINFDIKIWINGLRKKVSLLIFPVTIALAGITMNKDVSAFMDASIVAITMTVLYGVWQNIYSIHHEGKKKLPDIDFINELVGKFFQEKK